jgi:hypothetical protein
MRKADYAALAALIAEGMRSAESRATLTWLARQFANRASVDRAAFLKACAIPAGLTRRYESRELAIAAYRHVEAGTLQPVDPKNAAGAWEIVQ